MGFRFQSGSESGTLCIFINLLHGPKATLVLCRVEARLTDLNQAQINAKQYGINIQHSTSYISTGLLAWLVHKWTQVVNYQPTLSIIM